jgi:hypothetical protein
VLPYAVLLLCPLIHIFMHRGHNGHNHSHEGPRGEDDRKPRDGGLS